MAEISPISPIQPPSNEQSSKISHPQTETEKRSQLSKFLNVFKRRKISNDDTDNMHGLYNLCRHYAEGVKISIQMGIGVILGIALLIMVLRFSAMSLATHPQHQLHNLTLSI